MHLSYTKKSLPLSDTTGGNCACRNKLDECLFRLFNLLKYMIVSGYEKQRTNTQGFTFQFPVVFLTCCVWWLYLSVNTAVDYRSVCTHAVALYIFRKRFCKLIILTLFDKHLWFPLGCHVLFKGVKKKHLKECRKINLLKCVLCLWQELPHI